MRRTHLRGHANILKRVLVHASGFNLGLIMRQVTGLGTPRGLQGQAAALLALFLGLWDAVVTLYRDRLGLWNSRDLSAAVKALIPSNLWQAKIGTCTTGC